jgi:nicotinate dehydrogenase subunit A
MGTTIKLTVNGKAEVLHADDPGMPLLYALRDELGLHGRPEPKTSFRNSVHA